MELHQAGSSGGLVIEWEDNDAKKRAGALDAKKRAGALDAKKRAGALAALAAVRAADLPPSSGRHDDALRAIRQKELMAAS